jgi:N-acyl homoserine lactone hydrolase
MKRARRRWLIVLAVLCAAASLLASSFCAAPLPAPPPLEAPLPPARPPAQMALRILPTGVIHRNAALAYRGGSFSDARDFTMTAVLVEHPHGDVLIDTGFGRGLAAQLQRMPWAFRMTTDHEPGTTAADQLDTAGYDRERLRAILITHAHWDHVSGIADFAGVPVMVTADEHRFIADGGWITALARESPDAQYQEYAFDDGAYLGFPASHDLHGDGAIVVVPAPGHTPGSVIVFVSLPDQRRFAFIGDLAWQSEGVTQREERAWPLRMLADDDPAQLRDALLRMSAIAARFPEITIVPAHDARPLAGQ